MLRKEASGQVGDGVGGEGLAQVLGIPAGMDLASRRSSGQPAWYLSGYLRAGWGASEHRLRLGHTLTHQPPSLGLESPPTSQHRVWLLKGTCLGLLGQSGGPVWGGVLGRQ